MPDKDSLFIHSIGSKIRLYRKYRGLTQKELGDACGLNESTIRNYELGNRYPDKQTLTQIAMSCLTSSAATASFQRK